MSKNEEKLKDERMKEEVNDEGRLRLLGREEKRYHKEFTESNSGVLAMVYVLHVNCDQPIKTSVIKEAVVHLQRQIEILQCRIVELNGDYWFCRMTKPTIEFRIIPRDGSTDWRKEHRRILANIQLDTKEGPLWCCDLLLDDREDNAVIYLTICHSVADGISVEKMFGKILENYHQLLSGKDVSDEFLQLSPNIEQLLDEQINMKPQAILNPFTDFSYKDPNRSFYHSLSLPYKDGNHYSQVVVYNVVDGINNLRQACRIRGIAMTSALSAVVMLAGHKIMKELNVDDNEQTTNNEKTDECNGKQNDKNQNNDDNGYDKPTCMTSFYPFNIRREILNDVKEFHHYLAAVGFTRGQHYIDNSTSFWNLAKIENEQKRNNLQERKECNFWANLDPLTFGSFDYILNNGGCVDDFFPNNSILKPTRLHRAMKYDFIYDIMCTHYFTALGNRIMYDLLYVEGRMKKEVAEKYSNYVVEILKQIIQSVSEGNDVTIP